VVPNKRDNREKESAAVPRMLSRHLETVALGISCISFSCSWNLLHIVCNVACGNSNYLVPHIRST